MAKIKKLEDGTYNIIINRSEEVILAKRQRMINKIKHLNEGVIEAKAQLAKYNLALGREAEDETAIR